MLSGDIIERRIQMSPELLGFPGSSHPPLRSAPASLSHADCQSSPGTSPSFPASHAFLWPFDATRTPIRHCLEEPGKAID